MQIKEIKKDRHGNPVTVITSYNSNTKNYKVKAVQNNTIVGLWTDGVLSVAGKQAYRLYK